jgi:hypothetical protein
MSLLFLFLNRCTPWNRKEAEWANPEARAGAAAIMTVMSQPSELSPRHDCGTARVPGHPVLSASKGHGTQPNWQGKQ